MPTVPRSPILRRLSLSLLLVLGACAEEHVDEAELCFVSAEGEIVVEVSWACASDHRGAKLSCEIEVVDDDSLRIRSVFVEGRDPNDACAPPLVAECRSPPLADGAYEVLYGAETFRIDVSGEVLPPCGQD